MKSVKPNLMEYNKKPLIKFYDEVFYKVKNSLTGFVEAEEFQFLESEIELEDDMWGLFDTPFNIYFLEWKRTNYIIKKSADDPANVEHEPMLRYWNLFLTRLEPENKTKTLEYATI